MTDSDKLQIKEIVHEALGPMEERIELLTQESRALYQALFGLRGGSGLEHDVTSLHEEVEKLKIFKTRVVTLFAAIQAGLLILVQIIISWLKSKSG